jgi:Tfp pilus assembly protein PilO
MKLRQQQYLLLSAGIVLVALYILATEGVGRWSNALLVYKAMRTKQAQELSPEEIAEQRLAQFRKRATLSSLLRGRGHDYEQDQAGVVEYVTDCARASGTRLESIVPVASQSASLMKEIGFKLTSYASYHSVGKLINQVETGAVLVRVSKVVLSSESDDSTLLSANIEGCAYVIPGSMGGR